MRSGLPFLIWVAVLSAYGASEATGQGFSGWSSPASLGPTVNTSAVDG
jgi:hypothetical protein